MKQLLLIAMVSVVCSVVAVNWLSPSAGASAGGGHNNQQGMGQRQAVQQPGGNRQGGQRQGAQGQNTESAQAGNGRQGNRGGEQAAAGGQRQAGHGGQQAGGQRGGNRGGDSSEMLAGERGQRQGNRGGQSSGALPSGGHTHGGNAQGERAGVNSGQGGRNNRIAGFSAGDIENSLADMTAKLALSPDQQANIRQALETYQQSAKIAREQFMQTRAQLTALDVTVATYEEDKARVLQSAQAAYQELLLLTVSTREAIYQSLNSTQQQILTNLEA